MLSPASCPGGWVLCLPAVKVTGCCVLQAVQVAECCIRPAVWTAGCPCGCVGSWVLCPASCPRWLSAVSWHSWDKDTV
jgi:hypothetical protein